MKVGTPNIETGSASKAVDISTPYLYVEKILNENAFIIIDEIGDISGDPKFIDNDGHENGFYWQIVTAGPRRHIKVWADSNVPLVIKVVKLANDLDWRPVPNFTAPGAACSVGPGAGGALPRIALNDSNVHGIEYEDPTGSNLPRTKAARSKILTSGLTPENNGDDFVYVKLQSNYLIYYEKP